jgi:hypothetical protein
VRVLAARELTPPVPEIVLLKVMSSERLKASVPLSVTAPPPTEPVVPLFPTWSVPAEMSVVP